MVVELDERHRALDAVIERVVFRHAADPAEMGVGEVALDVGQPRGARAVRERDQIGVDQVQQVALLRLGHGIGAQALIGHNAVILIGAAEMQVVGEVATAIRHVPAHD